jgi:cyclic beta-1,2-glucan synthetase
MRRKNIIRKPRYNLVLSFFPGPGDAKKALRELEHRGFGHAAVISRSPAASGRVTVDETRARLSLWIFVLTGFLLLAGILVRLPFVVLVPLIGVAIAVSIGLARRFGLLLERKLIERLGRLVLPDESVLVVGASARDTARTFEAVGHIESASSVRVILRTPPFLGLTEPPRASETLWSGRLARLARRLMESHEITLTTTSAQPLLESLAECERTLATVRHDLTEAHRVEAGVSRAAEWLLDNAYIIHGHIDDIRRNLPRNYSKILPVLRQTPSPEFRVHALAGELVAHTANRVEQANIVDFLEAYQEASPLTMAELWVFPLMLRSRLIEDLARRAVEVSRRQHDRERADFWANRLLYASRRGPDQMLLMLAEVAREEPHLPPHFAVRLLGHLQDEEAALSAVQNWLQRKMGTPLDEILRQEQARQATDQVAIANAIGSLRRLGQLDWREVFEAVSPIEAILRDDPERLHARSDFSTRDRCRQAVEEIARHARLSELWVARRAVELARNGGDLETRQVGYYLIDAGRAELEAESGCRIPMSIRVRRGVLRRAAGIYLASIALTTGLMLAVVLALAVGSGASDVIAALGVAALFPASEFAVQVVNSLVNRFVPPRLLPRMSFKDGIPEEFRTLVVVPMMLLTRESLRGEVRKLEVRYLANPDPNLVFALLSDFADAPAQHMPDDAELLEIAIRGITELNERYGQGRFLLFHRERRFDPSEERWIGWERKRGKLEELNRYLNGERGSAGFLHVGDRGALGQIRFVITLDSDTQLPHGTARRMVETLSHPLNQPRLAPDGRSVASGYTIIQPRVVPSLPGATVTRFTRLFADAPGSDPYHPAASDVYQDLFGDAIYHGKAIYDVRVFHQVLSGRFPEDTLLSHDLIEGAYVRVALDSTTELLEQFPSTYPAYANRQHRWIRGDWQIARWFLPTVPAPGGGRERNPLSLINRWKIFDNLRRSLVPPVSFALLVASWFLLPRAPAWNIFVALALLWPSLARLPERIVRTSLGLRIPWREQAVDFTRVLVSAAILPHQAWVALDAILRVAYRRLWSGHRLLEWETAQVVHLRSRTESNGTLLQAAVLCALTAGVVVSLKGRGFIGWPEAAPFLALWLVSPALIAWLSQANRPSRTRPLDERELRFLRGLARRTWRFFDDLVGPESHWLPPDNTQEALRVEVAQRTSPTNIGMALLASVAAHDFGYITPLEVVERTESTFDTLERLERYEGHLLNWYDTRTLLPLRPPYVSTVDSGNLLACLWVLAQALGEMMRAPALGPAALEGCADTLEILREALAHDGGAHHNTLEAVPRLRALFDRSSRGAPDIGRRLRSAIGPARELAEAVGDSQGEAGYWARRLVRQVESWNHYADIHFGWLEQLPDKGEHDVPSLQALASGKLNPIETEMDLTADDRLGRAKQAAAELVARIEGLTARVHALGEGMNLRFLYDVKRRVFTIGHYVGERRHDSSYYDLLASEARLTSFVAIARGDVPVEHWWTLGRPYAVVDGYPALLSWGGTMFEYLMALVFNRGYENSLLEEACRGAVRLQMRYGRRRGIPWGISESAFSAVDSNQIYQYRAFGVPELALKRALEGDLVVAPYATALALAVDAPAAVGNLKKLARFGLAGPKGYYEAIDFTRSAREGEPGVVIYTYMAHHQGMTLLALDNACHDGILQRLFHADQRVRAAEPLLFERIPMASSAVLGPSPEHPPVRLITTPEPSLATRVVPETTPLPRAHLLGNGSYSVMLTNSGSGYSRWRDFDLTRWRADTTRDCHGSYCYLRDVDTGAVWSASFHPLGRTERYAVVSFYSDRVEFRRRVKQIESTLQVAVSPEDDVEIRRITLVNRSPRRRSVELTSYAELALAPHASDRAHPAFSKMFIQTEALPGGALLAWRRQRSPDEPEVWAAHLITPAPATGVAIEYETDRERFLGRGRGPHKPAGLERPLGRRAGFVLDPIFALRRRIDIEPRGRARIALVTAAAGRRADILSLVEKYRDPGAQQRAFELGWAHAQLELRYLGVQVDDAQRFQELAGHLLYPNSLLRPGERLRRNVLGQSRLWAHGISGDLPIITVTIGDAGDIDLVREVLVAHEYWRARGLVADLVILNKETGGYAQPLHQQLARLIAGHSMRTGTDRPGGVFLREVEKIPGDELTLIMAASRATLVAGRGSLAQQLGSPAEAVELPPPLRVDATVREDVSKPLPAVALEYPNGLGGFTRDGREYVITLGPGAETPAPWANVLANSSFGALVTESGQGFVWSGNSQRNRLFPWLNDPVSNASTQAIYLRDEKSGVYWTPTALPMRESAPYRARHGQGYSVFEHNSHGIAAELTAFVPVDAEGGAPIWIERLRLRNDSERLRRLTVTTFAEWTLGTDREETGAHVITTWDSESSTLVARNPYHPDFSRRVAFATIGPAVSTFSADRATFLGRNGTPARPAALELAHLDGRAGPALDPCAALQCAIELQPGREREIVVLHGEAEDMIQARVLVQRFRSPSQVEEALTATRAWWDELLGVVEVETPDAAVNMLLNRWLLYQTLGCRTWARSALYQSSGAFGFRDQLQDVMALVHAAPHLVREHLLRAASRQFVEGDVQHWWHDPSGGGVRTRCSDDLLWLPYATAHYVRVSGDASVLDTHVPFLEGRLLEAHEHEAYFVPTTSMETGSLYEHCRRAVEKSWTRGPHGLPLMGSGDWNDGLNRVGVGGQGESVWLAWFLIEVLRALGELSRMRGDLPVLETCRARADELVRAVENAAWDGEWYLRGFFDDGTPLGSKASQEARIDSLPQSWAVISGAGDPDRAARGLDAAYEHLVSARDRLVMLFTPPFERSSPHPGYIMGYPPGVRENGGQYTHGALWLALAFARLGRGDRAVEILRLLNPIEHSRTPAGAARYRVEPYVVAADIYALPGQEGRGGWTWYTGSSGWMYRIWLEEILGFRRAGERLTLDPKLPSDWPYAKIRYRHGRTRYEIVVENSPHSGEEVARIELDGARVDGAEIVLQDDGRDHAVRVRLGPRLTPTQVER